MEHTGAPSIIATGIEYIFAVYRSNYRGGIKVLKKRTNDCEKRILNRCIKGIS